MSDDEGWTVVVDKRRQKRAVRSRYISETTAARLQRDMDITGLADVLLSTESRNLQEDGWVFDRVIKNDAETPPEDEPRDTDTIEYICLPIQNRWNDRALFSRRIETHV